jgi:hypothetical protein
MKRHVMEECAVPTTLPLSPDYDRRRRQGWRVGHHSLRPSIGLLATTMIGFSCLMLLALSTFG